MIIKNIQHTKNTRSVTLSADIIFKGDRPETLYFSTDIENENYITGSDASPFLAAVLMPCMKTKENILIEGSISEQLFQNIKKIMWLVDSWNIGLSPVAITAKQIHPDSGKPYRTASFFSGGVDSFYTYLKNKETKEPVTDFIIIHGFDIPLSNTNLFRKVKKVVEDVAAEEQIRTLTVKTNITEIIEKKLIWDFAHGGALAAIMLFLRKQIKKVLIPGNVRYDELFPYGTHPQLDKLWSTETLTVAQDGNEYNRLGKILNVVSKSPLALNYLRVCTQNVNGKYNCSHCYKCLMTMIELTCANAFDKATSFEHPIDLRSVRNMYYDYKLKYNLQGEANLAILTKENREPELREAIAYSLEKSKKMKLSKKIAKLVAYIDQTFNNRRIYRYIMQLNNKQDRNVMFKFLLKTGLIK